MVTGSFIGAEEAGPGFSFLLCLLGLAQSAPEIRLDMCRRCLRLRHYEVKDTGFTKLD